MVESIRKEKIYEHMTFLTRIEKLIDRWDETREVTDQGYATVEIKKFTQWALEEGLLIWPEFRRE